jgi:hypothetical protein
MKKILNRISKWWRKFVEEYIVKEVDPYDPNF